MTTNRLIRPRPATGLVGPLGERRKRDVGGGNCVAWRNSQDMAI
jgi:hypothetical protein